MAPQKPGSPQLPRQQAQLTDPTRGIILPEWYNALNRIVGGLQGQITDIQSVIDDIKAIALALGSPDGDVSGIVDIITRINSKADKSIIIGTAGSLSGGGTLAQNLTLRLSGDSDDPGALEFYGTDAADKKGFHAISDVAVTSVDGFKGAVAITNDDPSIIVRDSLNSIFLSVNVVDCGYVPAVINTRVTASGDTRTTSTGDIRVTA